MTDELSRVEQPADAMARDSGSFRASARCEEVGVRDFLAFAVGDEQYALPLSAIREIMKPPLVTEVPFAPRNVLGIVSVRGRVTTLIDMRRKLKAPERVLTVKARVILVDQGEEEVGLLVDNVLAEYVMGIGRPSRHSFERSERSYGSLDNTTDQLLSAEAAEESAHAEMLILLDPVALLKG
jgi:purine-binding chemotaxis protein CheW